MASRRWLRHSEAAIAALLWLGCLPLLLYMSPRNNYMYYAVAMLALIHVLSVHGFIVNQWLDSEEQDQMMNGAAEPPRGEESRRHRFHYQATPARGPEKLQILSEEYRVLFVVFVLISAITSTVMFKQGGSKVFQTWISLASDSCSVDELLKLQRRGFVKFYCDDGFVDKSKLVSIFHREDHMYHMAPVYRKDSETGEAPVALAVAKDSTLSRAPCAGGLCGILLTFESSGTYCGVECRDQSEGAVYDKLTSYLKDRLHFKDRSEFDLKDLPVLRTIDPISLGGESKFGVVAGVFYAVSLLGLSGIVLITCLEDQSTRPQSEHGDESYEQLELVTREDRPSRIGA